MRDLTSVFKNIKGFVKAIRLADAMRLFLRLLSTLIYEIRCEVPPQGGTSEHYRRLINRLKYLQGIENIYNFQLAKMQFLLRIRLWECCYIWNNGKKHKDLYMINRSKSMHGKLILNRKLFTQVLNLLSHLSQDL
jgi:hypothetical protein